MSQVHVPEHTVEGLRVTLRRGSCDRAANQEYNDTFSHAVLSFVIISFCRNGNGETVQNI